ncbi:antitoxin VapB family protein [Candidatus Woesearchaeota archaeon]|nr:antitoxin VapB family protein [Candidatus Woesearchaeota archaeon]
MARTIMIADRIYEELKKAKGSDKSFSDVIGEALEASKPKKTIAGVLKYAGILKGDTEYDELMKWSKKRWKEWQDRSWKKSV